MLPDAVGNMHLLAGNSSTRPCSRALVSLCAVPLLQRCQLSVCLCSGEFQLLCSAGVLPCGSPLAGVAHICYSSICCKSSSYWRTAATATHLGEKGHGCQSADYAGVEQLPAGIPHTVLRVLQASEQLPHDVGLCM